MRTVPALALIAGLVVASGCGGFSSERRAAREAGVQMDLVVTDLLMETSMFAFEEQQQAAALGTNFARNVQRTGYIRGLLTVDQAAGRTPACAVQYEITGVQVPFMGSDPDALVSMRLVRLAEDALVPDPERLGMLTIDPTRAELLASSDALVDLNMSADAGRIGEIFADDVAWAFYHTTIAYAAHCGGTPDAHPDSIVDVEAAQTPAVEEEPAVEEAPAVEEEPAAEETPVVEEAVEAPAEETESTDGDGSPFSDVD